MTLVSGLLVLASLATVFTAGVALGRRLASQRHVDRLLAKETRFRNSVAQPHTRVLPPVRVADGPKPNPLGSISVADVEACRGAISRVLQDSAWSDLATMARVKGRCGKPVHVHVGMNSATVPCLFALGHDGACQ